jgi:acetyl esterase/lipase
MKPDLFVNISLLLIFALTASGCYVHLGAQSASAATTETSTRYALAKEIRNVVYSEPDWPQSLRADLYLPQKRGPLPVVLVIHGGGWAGRSRDDMSAISLDLVHRGYAVMNLDYRFAPQYTFPAQLEDLQQARRWLSKTRCSTSLTSIG